MAHANQVNQCVLSRVSVTKQFKSVIFLISFQTALILGSQEASALFRLSPTRVSQSNPTNSIFSPQVTTTIDIDEPLVLNTNSLYKTSRHKRSTASTKSLSSSSSSSSVDACESKMEVLTPYHATNSKGKLRTIVNSELMQQAIQVETCLRSHSSHSAGAPDRCNAQPDCGCEQKYKWHRLLVLDPSGDAGLAKGLFMDWFLFPSNCVCRCKSGPSSRRQFFRTIQPKI